jgi:hypothetical protein
MTTSLHGAGSQVFWGEISPCDHLVQFYDSNNVFLDTLEGFVRGGLNADEAVIVIATPPHLKALTERLAAGIDVEAARARDQFITLDAEETLNLFMKNGWPDDERFFRLVNGLLKRAKSSGRKVRAFGEMVAVMWARGEHGATVRLEHLWHELCATEGFSLLCAYPKAGFTQDHTASISEICAAHSKVMPH